MASKQIQIGSVVFRENKECDYLATYYVRVYCGNCDEHDSLIIPKGVKKPRLFTCPNCGCSSTT